jgi:hypothetical protein
MRKVLKYICDCYKDDFPKTKVGWVVYTIILMLLTALLIKVL